MVKYNYRNGMNCTYTKKQTTAKKKTTKPKARRTTRAYSRPIAKRTRNQLRKK